MKTPNKDQIGANLKSFKLVSDAANTHVSSAENSHTEKLNGVPVVFTNMQNVSSDHNTIARTIGVTYKEYTTRLTVIMEKTPTSVNVKIVPLVHPTLKKPLEFSIEDPKGPPPAPDFSFSAGWFGWAGSLSEAEVQSILTAANSGAGTAVRTAVTTIVAHFNWIAGLIVAFVLAIGPFLLKAFDDFGRNRGVCFVDTWIGIWWLRANPVPWGF